MANGIYMGGEVLKGIGSKQIRDLVSEIKKQQEKFSKQAGKFNLWDKGGDLLKGLAGLTKNPLFMGLAHGADFLIDEFVGKSLMKKAGDPEAIKKLQTAYTGGGYEEEFKKMKKEGTPDTLSSALEQGLGLASSYIGSEVDLSGVGGEIGDWFSELFGKDIGGEWGSNIPKGDYKEQMWREGGYVPKKYYGGGSVQGGTPTIADYFSMQGKTLGGNNKQSLAEKLGRV